METETLIQQSCLVCETQPLLLWELLSFFTAFEIQIHRAFCSVLLWLAPLNLSVFSWPAIKSSQTRSRFKSFSLRRRGFITFPVWVWEWEEYKSWAGSFKSQLCRRCSNFPFHTIRAAGISTVPLFMIQGLREVCKCNTSCLVSSQDRRRGCSLRCWQTVGSGWPKQFPGLA